MVRGVHIDILHIGKPSKDPCNPDYAPSIFSYSTLQAPVVESTLSRCARAIERRRRKQDIETAHTQKKRCKRSTYTSTCSDIGQGVDIEDNADVGGNSSNNATDDGDCIMDINLAEGDVSDIERDEGDCVEVDVLPVNTESDIERDEDDDCVEASVLPDRDDIEEASFGRDEDMHDVILSLQEKICKLEEEKKGLMEKHGGFEIVATQVASANVELVAQNRQLVEAIEERQACTVKVGYGPSSIVDDDVKTCFYTGLPTYAIFVTLFEVLKQFHHGSANINYFFATLLYL